MKIMLWKFTTILLLLPVAGVSVTMAASLEGAQESIGTDRTRYIYLEGTRQIGVTLNQNTRKNYLVQAWVRGIDPVTGDVKNESTPFFLKQPLVKTMPDSRYGFQVIQTRPVISGDRESVYLLSFKFIPAQEKGKADVFRANVVMTYNVKLFYRPKTLKDGNVTEASTALTFSRQGDRLAVRNPTPYWIIFYSLQVGQERLPDSALRQMVPPFREVWYRLPGAVKGRSVVWRLLSEEGHPTPAVTSPL